MSFWSKFFKKEDVPQIQQLEAELGSILKKAEGDFLILVGLVGKLKGLDIITLKDGKKTSFQDRQLKSFAAKGAEFLTRFKVLDFMPAEIGEPARVIKFYYNRDMQFYIFPLPTNPAFMLMSYNCIAVHVLKDIDKILPILDRIRPPEKEDEKPKGGGGVSP
jgi:hypothetical protein